MIDVETATLEELLSTDGELNECDADGDLIISAVGIVTAAGNNLEGYEEAVAEILNNN